MSAPVKQQRVDIAVLCHNAQTLLYLVEPAKTMAVAVDRFRKWESPILCIAALTTVTTLCVLLPSVYFLFLNLSLIGCVAGIGIAHLKGNVLLKVIPRPIAADNYNRYLADLPEPLTHGEIMTQFKQILLQTDRIILGLSKLIEKFYEIMKWDDFNHSLRCYSISTVLVLLLHVLPLRWTITLFIDGFVIYYPLKKFIIEKYFTVNENEEDQSCATLQHPAVTDTISVSQSFVPSDDEEMDDDIYSENSSSDMSEPEGLEFGSPEDAAETDQKVKINEQIETSDSVAIGQDAPVACLDEDGDTQSYDLENSVELESNNVDVLKKVESQQLRCDLKSGSEGNESTGSDTGSVESSRFSSSNRPTGVVGRIMEFKRKQQQANTGTCVGCGVNFTTILKRKRNCNYCGNNFCSKCCSFKVAKSFLGATAPGSQTELVAVCQECHQYLTVNEKDLTDIKPKLS